MTNFDETCYQDHMYNEFENDGPNEVAKGCTQLHRLSEI